MFSAAERARIEAEVASEAEIHSDSILKILNVTDALVMQQVRGAMRLLLDRGRLLGVPSLGAEVQVKDKLVSNLLLGGKPQANSYDLVDSITHMVGGTATLFVKNGEEFVRVSTNVITNNARAVGTVLDPKGKAIAAIREGKGYYGVVDILNEPYLTAYEPMRDAQGSTIGVWYVGYKVDMDALKESIAKSRILKSGFLAVIDAKGVARFHPSHVSPEQAATLARDGSPGWQVSRQTFDQWGFTIVSAYPHNEVSELSQARALAIIIVGVIGSLTVIMLITSLLRRLVLQPLGGEPEYVTNSMRRIANGDLTGDIHVQAEDNHSLMASLKVMQLKLKNISASIQENADVLNEQVGSFDKVAQSYEQTRSEQDFSEVLRMSKKIGRTADVLCKSIARIKL